MCSAKGQIHVEVLTYESRKGPGSRSSMVEGLKDHRDEASTPSFYQGVEVLP